MCFRATSTKVDAIPRRRCLPWTQIWYIPKTAFDGCFDLVKPTFNCAVFDSDGGVVSNIRYAVWISSTRSSPTARWLTKHTYAVGAGLVDVASWPVLATNPNSWSTMRRSNFTFVLYTPFLFGRTFVDEWKDGERTIIWMSSKVMCADMVYSMIERTRKVTYLHNRSSM